MKKMKKMKKMMALAVSLLMVGTLVILPKTVVKASGAVSGDVITWSEQETNDDGIGTGGGAFQTAQKFGPEDLVSCKGKGICGISFYLVYSWAIPSNVTAEVYSGGDGRPETLLASKTVDGSELPEGWNTIGFDSPADIDVTQNLWLVVKYGDGGAYPAGCYTGTNVKGKGDLVTLDGYNWAPIADYGLDYTWLLKGHLCSMETEGDWLDPLRTQLHIAADPEFGANVNNTAEYTGDFALPREILQYIKDHPQVTLNYSFYVDDVLRTVTINGQNVVLEEGVEYYGFNYLLSHYGDASAVSGPTGIYTIVKGDTLTSIAKKFGTTVSALAAKNGIKNVDLIYAGSKIAY